jgi:hypothetical protein
MKVIQISDELYDRLRNCVVDPFDDSPDSVIGRLIAIAEKARNRWSPLDGHVEDARQQAASQNEPHVPVEHWNQPVEQVL